jgi:hypothetical protein
VTTDVAVGQMRAIEFVANEPGDWAFHCHKSHHTMNAMGHDVPTMIGVDQSDLVGKINQLVPGHMAMGDKGMADMGEMEMPIPENTLPVMTGSGPFGGIGMGGMFTTVKVRNGLARIDYKDPGRYRHPAGSLAYEWKEGGVAMPDAARAPDAKAMAARPGEKILNVTKGKSHHEH